MKKQEVLLHSNECVHKIRNAVVNLHSLQRRLKNDQVISEQDNRFWSVQLCRFEEALQEAQKDTLWNWVKRRIL